ncbi:MAG: ribonuclease HII [Spirochaetales bacterium]
MRVCGIDEAGRGPLAGPVTAAAFIPGKHIDLKDFSDSKALSARRRSTLAEAIALSDSLWATGWVWPDEIDRLNIHNAALEAMSRAWNNLRAVAELRGRFPEISEIRVDGKFVPGRLSAVPDGVAVKAVIGGDRCVPEISAASIVAKVLRDRWMQSYAAFDSRYGFAVHKGYPTALHREALRSFGPCGIHRRSFRGVHARSASFA